MLNLLITISVAVSAFIATNLDDLFILMVFFAHPDYDSSSVIMGQYLGIIGIILICIPVYLLKSFIPPFWLGLMGLIPLYLGLEQLCNLRENKINSDSSISDNNIFNESKKNSNTTNEKSDKNKQNKQTPNTTNEKSDKNKQNKQTPNTTNEKSDKNKQTEKNTKYKKLAWLSVASITITNGADNIGVYIPLFTNLSQVELLLTILIFLIMTGIWCLGGRFIIGNRRLGGRIKQYGHIILPFVLIILGTGIFLTNILKI